MATGEPQELDVTVEDDAADTASTARKRLPAILTKQRLYVERLDCFAVSFFGVERGTACLKFARSACFNASAVLITLLSMVHFVVGGSRIAEFSVFFEAAFGTDVHTLANSNRSFVPLEGADNVAVFTHLAAMEGFIELWGILGAVLFGFQFLLISFVLLTLNVPAARRSLGSFNGLFQLYNLLRWSFSFHVSFVYMGGRDKLLYILFMAGMVLCWT